MVIQCLQNVFGCVTVQVVQTLLQDYINVVIYTTFFIIITSRQTVHPQFAIIHRCDRA